mmetsp:Transcript_17221/g.58893  ORF Transcript_17221/g.58893 Transcript_17221/m.58893 type:complete len:401 (-) Transcript_17221:22-1224(-)
MSDMSGSARREPSAGSARAPTSLSSSPPMRVSFISRRRRRRERDSGGAGGCTSGAAGGASTVATATPSGPSALGAPPPAGEGSRESSAVGAPRLSPRSSSSSSSSHSPVRQRLGEDVGRGRMGLTNMLSSCWLTASPLQSFLFTTGPSSGSPVVSPAPSRPSTARTAVRQRARRRPEHAATAAGRGAAERLHTRRAGAWQGGLRHRFAPVWAPSIADISVAIAPHSRAGGGERRPLEAPSAQLPPCPGLHAAARPGVPLLSHQPSVVPPRTTRGPARVIYPSPARRLTQRRLWCQLCCTRQVLTRQLAPCPARRRTRPGRPRAQPLATRSTGGAVPRPSPLARAPSRPPVAPRHPVVGSDSGDSCWCSARTSGAPRGSPTLRRAASARPREGRGPLPPRA